MASNVDVEKNRSEFRSLLAKRGNELCADCGSSEPTWVSINLGVFICSECAGVHRCKISHASFLVFAREERRR